MDPDPARRPDSIRLPTAAVVLLLGLAAAALAGVGSADDDESPPLRVLFLGNSLTYTNDLPGRVRELSLHGGREVETGAIAAPNAALEDLWRDGRARQEIASGRWDAVVMQQGPSSLLESRTHLVRWTCRFAEAARKAGARPAVFSVWPPAARDGFFGRVLESYRLAADRCDCLHLPVGEAWRTARSRDPEIRLRGPDGFHPTPEGTLIAALTIWAGLTGEEPAGLPDEAFHPVPSGPATDRLREISRQR